MERRSKRGKPDPVRGVAAAGDFADIDAFFRPAAAFRAASRPVSDGLAPYCEGCPLAHPAHIAFVDGVDVE
jgi:hypothetical protein